VKHSGLLAGEGLDSYESFYRLLFQQLHSFHSENIHLKQELLNEQFKSSSLQTEVEKSDKQILSLQNSLSKSSLDLQEIRYQYDNLLQISIGNYQQENLNLLLDEISELRQQFSQSQSELLISQNLNLNLETELHSLQRKYELVVEEMSLLKDQQQDLHQNYQNEAYENFLHLFDVLQEANIDLESEVQWVSSSQLPGSCSQLTITPSTTSPAYLLIQYPSSSTTTVSSSSSLTPTLTTVPSHRIFLLSPPSTPLLQQIYHQIINFPLNGALFESFIALLFQCHGYRPSLRSHSYDNGIDIDLTYADPMKIWKGVVQCKQYTYKIGSHLIREFIGSMLNDGCHSGYVVTTSYYTREAYKTAEVWRQKGNQIELWDMKILLEKMAPYEERLMQGIAEMRSRGDYSTSSSKGVLVSDVSDVSEYVRVQEAAAGEGGGGGGGGGERQEGGRESEEAEEGVADEEEEIENEKICLTRGDRVPSPPFPSLFFNEDEIDSDSLTHLLTISPSPSGDTSPIDISASPSSDENMKCSPNNLQVSAPSPSPRPGVALTNTRQKYTFKKPYPSTPTTATVPPPAPSSSSLSQPMIPSRNTSPKRVRTPFTPNDKETDRYSWTVEETNALAQLVIRFSQNANHRINWGQMDSWLKLSEGKTDPIGKLIREEHKDKEKLRSKWKNESRMKGATNVSPSRRL
jgi:HJR/Mrr/RecB family endonuclease